MERKFWLVRVLFDTKRRGLSEVKTYRVDAVTAAEATNEVCWLHYGQYRAPRFYCEPVLDEPQAAPEELLVERDLTGEEG